MFDRTFMVCTRALAPNILCPCPLCRRDAEIERLQRENTNLRNTARKSYDTVLQTMEANSASHRRVEEHGVATIRTLTAKLEEAEKRREQADRLQADVKACEEFLASAGRPVVRVDGRIVGCIVPFGADLRGENKTLRDAMARDQETIADLQADVKAHVAAAEAGGREIARLTAGCDNLRRERDRMQGERDTLRKQKEAADAAAYRLAGKVDDLTAKLEEARHPAAFVFDVPGACRSMADAMNAACIAELDKVQYLKDIRDRVGDRDARLATVDWFPNGEPKIVFALRVSEAR